MAVQFFLYSFVSYRRLYNTYW